MLGAVIFDFDGVVADDERLHLAGFRHALAALGLEVSDADYFDRYLGFADRDGFNAMLRDSGREGDEALLARLMADKERAFRELVRERVTIFPGVRELLLDLRTGPDAVVTGIGSGALRSEIQLVLDIAGLAPSFDLIVAADDVARSKPDPETFVRACSGLARLRPGLEAQQCLVIEDSMAGLAAATRAGMKTVAVTNSYVASDLEADLVVASLEQIDRARCASLFD